MKFFMYEIINKMIMYEIILLIIKAKTKNPKMLKFVLCHLKTKRLC